jgi:hypothetical protein
VEINDLLNALDRTAANLANLEKIWSRAEGFIPKGPWAGSSVEYDDLCRAWDNLLPGLPKIDGWTITGSLPDIDAMGRSFIDYGDIGEIAFPLFEEGEQPGRDLAAYRYRLNQARRRAARERLELLTAQVDLALPRILSGVDRQSKAELAGSDVDAVTSAVAEVERLLGDSAERTGRWSDLSRHLHFGEGHDWHDIAEFDWPTVRSDVEAASMSDTDPIPTPDIDLGLAASGALTGAVATALPWPALSDDGFERLLYDLLRDYPSHENVQWLTRTHAPDRGRDLSFDRVLRDPTGGARVERVLVQAKHWQTKSVGPADVSGAVTGAKLWEPPLVQVVIVATSGRFTSDAVAWAERHNHSGSAPRIELWPESKLESLLAQKPHIAAAHSLR